MNQFKGSGPRKVLSGFSEHPDVHQRHVSQNLQLTDPAQVLDPVLVVQLVESVNGDSEVLRVAEDDHLQGDTTASVRKLRR